MKFASALLNSHAMQSFLTDVRGGKLSHAYMLITPDKDVVDDFFKLMSCAIYCKNGICLSCLDCKRVMDGNNVNIKYIESEKGKQLGADVIKDMIDDTHIKAYEDGVKLYFIPYAETMTVQAQNKLLKTLEEPSDNVTVVLGAGREGAMLDTVLSRVKKLYLDYFDTATINSALRELYPSADVSFAAVCADGMLGRADKIANDVDFKDLYDGIFDLLKTTKRSADVVKIYRSPLFAKEKIEDALNITELIMRDIIAVKSGSVDTVISVHKIDDIRELCNDFSIAAAAATSDFISECRDRLRFNCDEEAIAERLLYKIQEVKFLCR